MVYLHYYVYTRGISSGSPWFYSVFVFIFITNFCKLQIFINKYLLNSTYSHEKLHLSLISVLIISK